MQLIVSEQVNNPPPDILQITAERIIASATPIDRYGETLARFNGKRKLSTGEDFSIQPSPPAPGPYSFWIPLLSLWMPWKHEQGHNE